MGWNQEISLLPLSDWLSQIFDISLNPDNLIENLESGVVLCKLAKLIEEKAALVDDDTLRPIVSGRIHLNALPGSFFARDNVAIFIKFCRDMGINSSLLFETNDLVYRGEVRSVLICLMEVSKLAVKYGITQDKNFEENYALLREKDYENGNNPLPAQINDEETTENDISDGPLKLGSPETNELVKTTELDLLKVREEVAKISANMSVYVEEVYRNFQNCFMPVFKCTSMFLSAKYLLPSLGILVHIYCKDEMKNSF